MWNRAVSCLATLLQHHQVQIYADHTQEENPPAILINGIPLDIVDSYKYLGLLISSDLSWSHHMTQYVAKLEKF